LRIFISPLDWGLGHAARCIPIIRYLIEREIKVLIGAEGSHLIFLKEHFPDIEYIEFPGYRISYSAYLPAGVKVLVQLPHLVSVINKEHELLSKIIEEKKIDAVISDNRYGLWSKKVPSVIITHQLNIQAPTGENILSKTIYNYVRHFDECWIPDFAGQENLSGVVSHPIPKGINGKYIGPLSRFESARDSRHNNLKYDLLVILSGLEPQRSKLEEMVLKQVKTINTLKTLIIQGIPGNTHTLAPSLPDREGVNSIEIVPHLEDSEFQEKMNCSEVILSRPGYSTIMDLYRIGWRKAIFIPTPGQTEQEYLGKLMEQKGIAVTFNQKGFSLKESLRKVKELSFTPPDYGKGIFKGVIDEWLLNMK
jgi:uncharacterized protein (TIGR00661 family)